MIIDTPTHLCYPISMDPADKKLISRITASIKAGNHPHTAARAAGLSYRQFVTWLEKGEQDPDSKYGVFFAAIDQADAVSEEALASRFVEATESDWKATEAYLTRRFPKNWGNKQHTTVHQQTEVSGTVDVRQLLSSDGFAAAIDAYYANQVGLPPGLAVEGEVIDVE